MFGPSFGAIPCSAVARSDDRFSPLGKIKKSTAKCASQRARMSIPSLIKPGKQPRNHGHDGDASNANQRLRHEIIPAQVQNCVRRKREHR